MSEDINSILGIKAEQNSDVVCSCEHCALHIAFDPSCLTKDNDVVTCPHCGLETKLSVPPKAEKRTGVIEPEYRIPALIFLLGIAVVVSAISFEIAGYKMSDFYDLRYVFVKETVLSGEYEDITPGSLPGFRERWHWDFRSDKTVHLTIRTEYYRDDFNSGGQKWVTLDDVKKSAGRYKVRAGCVLVSIEKQNAGMFSYLYYEVLSCWGSKDATKSEIEGGVPHDFEGYAFKLDGNGDLINRNGSRLKKH